MHQLNKRDDRHANAPHIHVQDFFNNHPISSFQWMVFFICFAIVLFDGFDTAAIGYLAPSLLTEWGIAKSALAPVLSAALVGLCAGSLLAGPLADKRGRKFVLAIAVFLFGVACTASAFVSTLEQLVVLRFITGLGLGAAMPNAVTLMSEFCPDQRRSTLINAMFCGFPLGAALGGFIAAWIIPQWGWRAVLLTGGIAPLLLSVPIIFLLPESVRYLVAMKKTAQRIHAILNKISPISNTAQFAASSVRPIKDKQGLALAFSRPYILGTLMLWLAYFMGLVIFYSIINWMPILLKDAGLSAKNAGLITALFPLGGISAVLFGWLMDRFNPNLIVICGYALTAVFIYLIGQTVGNLVLLVLVVICGGILMNAAQSSMGALAAAFYPTQARATGVAWMLGVGRFGGVAASFLIAVLSARNLTFAEIFTVLAAAGFIAAAALFIKHLSQQKNSGSI